MKIAANELRIVDAKEFRCGNYIYVDYFGNMVLPKAPTRLEKVNPYHLKDLYEGNTEWHYSAIPLTEEWLLKFGFNKTGIICRIPVTYSLELALVAGEFRIQTKGNGFTNPLNIKYVHQLQNLYFALTGKELEINSYI